MMISDLQKTVIRVTSLVVLLCTFPVLAADNGSDEVEIVATGTRAKAIKKKRPIYPTRALRSGTEGWVVVNFLIKEDGTTDNIVVLNTSIENYFEKAAVKAVSDWRYEPATRNGKPAIQYNTNVRQIFKIKNEDAGVTESFRSHYQNATDAIKANDLETAKDLITKLNANPRRLLSEVCYLDILKATYYQHQGKDKASLKYLNRALVIADKETSNNMYIALLRQAIVEHAKAGNYHSVLRYFNTLQEVDTDLAADDPLRAVVDAVQQKIASDEAIATEGRIPKCAHCDSREPYWSHRLYRNRFTIDQVDGEVSGIELLCGNHSVSLAYTPDMAWDVNKEWGECRLLVSGDTGTTFRVVELQGID